MKRIFERWSSWAVLAALVAVGAPALADEPIAVLSADRGELVWSPKVDAAGFVLTVSGPDGNVVRREFAAGKVPTLPVFEGGQALPDGAYRFELRAVPRVSPQQKRALIAARERGEQAVAAEQKLAFPFIQSAMQGSFQVVSGQVVLGDGPAEPRPVAAGNKATTDVQVRDQVIPDDLIVQGSACVGLDCVNNESFGFDTLRLKENNTRIKFDDTSASTGFPATDWQLTANDSASGGANKFSIEDITSSRVPFTVTGGAPTNSIFVDSSGRLGLKTSTPVLELQITDTDTPSIRLEQTNAGGFTAQTWDVAGNEANFFVRDVTGGSKLSFRIRPGAPTSSIDISADGDVGVGTGSPDTKLHLLGSADNTKLLVQNNSGTTTARELAELRNNGDPFIIFNDSSNAARWSNGLVSNTFVILDQADTQIEFQLQPSGNLTIGGTLTQNSSRTVKEGFSSVDGRSILSRVLEMPITTWSYKEEKGVRHMGPVAEDFFAAFQLGKDEKGITTTDSAGVAFAAIQGLYKEVVAQNSQLKAQNAELEGRLAALEKMVQALAAPGSGDQAAEKN